MASNLSCEDGDLSFQIAPMVDVVFVLMLFFMACVGAIQKQGALEVALPGGNTTLPPSQIAVSVTIALDGVVALNGQEYGQADDHELSRLKTWVRNTVETFGDRDPIVVHPNPDVRHERFVEVLSALNRGGAKKVACD